MFREGRGETLGGEPEQQQQHEGQRFRDDGEVMLQEDRTEADLPALAVAAVTAVSWQK